MDLILAALAAVVATVFTVDLVLDLRRRPRPHVAAYAVGIGMFALATWALAAALLTEWNGFNYRTFFLFGAVVNVPFLALGSTFLVLGRRVGHLTLIVVGGLAAMAVTLVTTTPFTNALPTSGIPHDIFGDDFSFGPRLLALIGGAGFGTILALLAIVGVFRFWTTNRAIAIGNGLIAAGAFAAAWGGSGLGFLGEAGAFAVSLLVASTLLWFGYRLTRRARQTKPVVPVVVLVGPSTRSPERAHTEQLIRELESHDLRVLCPAKDLEQWGAVGFSPIEANRKLLEMVDQADVLLIDLIDRYGIGVPAGYAAAKGIPVIAATAEGNRIPRPFRGVAAIEIYYHRPSEVADRVKNYLEGRG